MRGVIFLSKKGKSINGLMKHIRSQHQISIKGSKDKRDLLSMGYYHGYKAYRFVKTIQNPLSFSEFREISSVYEFDKQLKSLLYPVVMELETTIKNYTIDSIINNSQSDLEYIFSHKLTRSRDYKVGSKEYKKEISNNLNLRKNIDNIIARHYSKSKIIQHYVHSNNPVPLWGIFEHTTLGDLGNFVGRLNFQERIKLSRSIGIYDSSLDTNCELLSTHIYLIKDLRNAIAHNNIIFDCRFNTFDAKRIVVLHLGKNTGVKNINFKSITDYIVLIVFYMKLFGKTKKECNQLIRSYANAVKKLEGELKLEANYHKILGVDTETKLEVLKNW